MHYILTIQSTSTELHNYTDYQYSHTDYQYSHTDYQYSFTYYQYSHTDYQYSYMLHVLPVLKQTSRNHADYQTLHRLPDSIQDTRLLTDALNYRMLHHHRFEVWYK